jgi:hypothetical protein
MRTRPATRRQAQRQRRPILISAASEALPRQCLVGQMPSIQTPDAVATQHANLRQHSMPNTILSTNRTVACQSEQPPPPPTSDKLIGRKLLIHDGIAPKLRPVQMKASKAKSISALSVVAPVSATGTMGAPKVSLRPFSRVINRHQSGRDINSCSFAHDPWRTHPAPSISIGEQCLKHM